VREVAERKRAESALHEADRRKNEFLATLSHELRNPLAAVANAVRLLELAPPTDPQADSARQVLGRQVGHLVRLIDDLLDVSRITSGKITLRKELVDLETVVTRAVETVRPTLAARKQALDVSVAPVPMIVDGDPIRLAQVISNLLANAVKYTDEGGRIRLGVERVPGDLGEAGAIRVEDSGIGIAPDVLPRIFDLFSQADHPRDGQGGLGIGLALVRELVALHGGTVTASSAGAGRGAAFVVRLPLAPARAAETRAAAEPGGPSSAGLAAPTRRVLLVDDNRDSAESLAALLTMLGHEVYQAYDGPAALAAAPSWLPDLVLLDIGMPGMSGYEVARGLRADPRLDGATLIALTGYGSAKDRYESRAAGFDGHLVKPIDFDALEHIIQSLPTSRAPGRHSEAA